MNLLRRLWSSIGRNNNGFHRHSSRGMEGCPVNEMPEETEPTSTEPKEGQSEDKTANKAHFDINNIPIEEKRKYYRCGDYFSTLDNIQTWPEYVENSTYYFKKRGYKYPEKGKEINNELNKKVSLWQGDITTLEIDAIVNAANNSLLGGGGVDGCIHRAAGKGLLNECKTLNGCETGKAKMTLGHKLPAKKVIHTVGPIGENKAKLQGCYESCLQLVKEHQLKSVAFCSISTGIYGYPARNAAKVALTTVRDWLLENPDTVDRVIFCVFLSDDLDVYTRLMLQCFPYVPEMARDKGVDKDVGQATTLHGDQAEGRPTPTATSTEGNLPQSDSVTTGMEDVRIDDEPCTRPDNDAPGDKSARGEKSPGEGFNSEAPTMQNTMEANFESDVEKYSVDELAQGAAGESIPVGKNPGSAITSGEQLPVNRIPKDAKENVSEGVAKDIEAEDSGHVSPGDKVPTDETSEDASEVNAPVDKNAGDAVEIVGDKKPGSDVRIFHVPANENPGEPTTVDNTPKNEESGEAFPGGDIPMEETAGDAEKSDNESKKRKRHAEDEEKMDVDG